jgi:hypothetical protein
MHNTKCFVGTNSTKPKAHFLSTNKYTYKLQTSIRGGEEMTSNF